MLRLGMLLRGAGDDNKDQRDCERHESTAITVDIDDKKYALCVDEIVGVQKVVIRDVNALPMERRLFEGAAMLGDGSIAMIIGTEGIAKLSG